MNFAVGLKTEGNQLLNDLDTLLNAAMSSYAWKFNTGIHGQRKANMQIHLVKKDNFHKLQLIAYVCENVYTRNKLIDGGEYIIWEQSGKHIDDLAVELMSYILHNVETWDDINKLSLSDILNSHYEN